MLTGNATEYLQRYHCWKCAEMMKSYVRLRCGKCIDYIDYGGIDLVISDIMLSSINRLIDWRIIVTLCLTHGCMFKVNYLWFLDLCKHWLGLFCGTIFVTFTYDLDSMRTFGLRMWLCMYIWPIYVYVHLSHCPGMCMYIWARYVYVHLTQV